MIEGTHVGPYRVLTPMGSGGAVYLVRDTVRNRPVAIRMLESRLTASPSEIFDQRRAQALASLRHPHIVPFLETVEFASHIFAITEIIRGKSLDILIASQSDISLADKLRWIEELCEAVAYGHANGVVHGHIGPSMVVIDRSNHAQLLGFDVGLLPGSQRLSGFEAPEVIAGQAPTPSSDVFSIGAVAHALLTSMRPFEREPALRERPRAYEMTPMDDALGVEYGVIQIIERALCATPADRVVTIQELEIPFAAARSRIEQAADPFAMSNWPIERAGNSPSEIPLDFDPLGDDTLLSPRGVPQPEPLPEPVTPHLEHVQFTVYRPKAVRPNEWRPMLAYVHLSDLPPDAPPGARTPLEQVNTLAENELGSEISAFRNTTTDAMRDVPREGEITLVPTVPGVEFNPERRTFRWVQDVQAERFLLRARPELNGRIARGRVYAYLGVLLIAEVELVIRVDASLEMTTVSHDAVRTRAFRNIFASYSHQDKEIVRQFEAFAATLGDRYLRDVYDLRAGQSWRREVLRLIDRADVFQLFWSSTAMRSPHVREEWEYALSLKRPEFVRPTYWEEPLPESPQEDLPPEMLRELQFQRISLAAGPSLSIPHEASTAAAAPPGSTVVMRQASSVDNAERQLAQHERHEEARQRKEVARRQQEEHARRVEEERQQEEALRQQEEHARRVEEERQREEALRQQEEHARRVAEERQREEALRQQEDHARQVAEERRQDEADRRRREQLELARNAERERQLAIERHEREEEARRREEEARRRKEESARQDEEARQRQAAFRLREELARRAAEERHRDEADQPQSTQVGEPLKQLERLEDVRLGAQAPSPVSAPMRSGALWWIAVAILAIGIALVLLLVS